MNKSISFNINKANGNEGNYINEVLNDPRSFQKKIYSTKCTDWFKQTYGNEFFLTPSCTKALEFASDILELEMGDEIVLPSFTHVSTANAFARTKAKLIFIDVNPDNMVLDPQLISAAVTKRTKAVVVTNYGGFTCELDKLKQYTSSHGIILIEDNAHGILAKYKDRYLGTFGDLSCFSFERQKNITCGEGGGLLVNNKQFLSKARLIYNSGTNSEAFYQGKVSEYTWKGVGTKYGLSELDAAYLWGQLERSEEITSHRRSLWNKYMELLTPMELDSRFRLPHPLQSNQHNAHILFLLMNSQKERSGLIDFLKEKNVEALFHYVPLHVSDYGKEIGKFIGPKDYSGELYKGLIRLPIHAGMDLDDVEHVSSLIDMYFSD